LGRTESSIWSLELYSADSHEQAHNTKLKDGWNFSNLNLNYLLQVTTFQCSILFFEIGELPPQALIPHLEHSAGTSKVYPSGADLAASMSSQSYAKPQFMGPHNSHNGKNLDTMMKDFRVLLDDTQNETHHMAVYSSLQEFIKHRSHNKKYISNELLPAMERCSHHGTKDQVEGVASECVSPM
jgi:hypothetical protein